MKPYFDRRGHPQIQIAVSGRKQKRLITAILDTGFDGYISLPLTVAIELGLELLNMVRVQYADGRVANELLFNVNVDFSGQTQTVQATLTNSIEALVGTSLLAKNKVTFDFPKKKITIS